MNNPRVDAVLGAVGDSDCLVALGGGADSAVLLLSAVEALGRERVAAVFVYHGLEGSDDLRTAARAVSERCEVVCHVVDGVIDDGGNLEARARAARYGAIEAMIPAGTIALTAHTADDQAETVLMRILRGSGSGAISGIPHRRGIWRRPFLGETRAALRVTAQQADLPFTDDPANKDVRFMRSRVRHEVMPVIDKNCGPDARGGIVRSSMLLAADDGALEAIAGIVPILPIEGGVSIPTGPLVSASAPIASRVVRRALRMVLNEYPGTAADIDAVMAVARGGETMTISRALRVTREPPFVVIHAIASRGEPDEIEIRVGDSFNWVGDMYSTYVANEVPTTVAGGRFTVLRADTTHTVLGLRGARVGDRIDIGTGSTPVKELLRTAGIPIRLRPHSLVVTVDAKIAALVGVRVAAWARAKRGEEAVIIEREVGTWT